MYNTSWRTYEQKQQIKDNSLPRDILRSGYDIKLCRSSNPDFRIPAAGSKAGIIEYSNDVLPVFLRRKVCSDDEHIQIILRLPHKRLYGRTFKLQRRDAERDRYGQRDDYYKEKGELPYFKRPRSCEPQCCADSRRIHPYEYAPYCILPSGAYRFGSYGRKRNERYTERIPLKGGFSEGYGRRSQKRRKKRRINKDTALRDAGLLFYLLAEKSVRCAVINYFSSFIWETDIYGPFGICVFYVYSVVRYKRDEVGS